MGVILRARVNSVGRLALKYQKCEMYTGFHERLLLAYLNNFIGRKGTTTCFSGMSASVPLSHDKARRPYPWEENWEGNLWLAP